MIDRFGSQFYIIVGLLALCGCASKSEEPLELQVSNTPGAQGAYHTIVEARNAIRSMKSAGKFPSQGVVVEIHGGVYPIRETIELTAEDAGHPEAPVVYRARVGEEVFLSGGQSIPASQFSKVSDPEILARMLPESRDKVVLVDLAHLGITDLGEIKQQGFSTPFLPAHMEVYVDGQPLELAKWPNEGTLKIGEVFDSGSIPMNELHGGKFQDPALLNPNYAPRGGTFAFDYDRADRWKKASDIWLKGVFARGFAHDNLQVSEIDFENRTFTVSQPHLYGIHPWGEGSPMEQSRRYIVYNLLEELDLPGECFVDKAEGKLYFMPHSDRLPESIEVTIMEEPIVAIEDTEYLRIEGITIENGRGMGIYMENSEHVVLDNLTVRGFGTLGIMMGQGVTGGYEGPVHEFTGTPVSRHVGNIKAHHYENTTWDRKAGRNCIIQNSKIYNTGQGGIIVDGGSKIDLSRGDNVIVNCELYRNSNLRGSYSPAVSVYGVGNTIRRSRIHHQPHNAITLFGNDHLVEFNEIDHILQEDFEDMGAVYIGRNPSDMGNRIVGNYFHDIIADEHRRLTGVYLDDGTGGTFVANNVFYKVGSPAFGAVYVHFGHRNTFEGNVFVDCPLVGSFFLNTKRWETRRESKLWRKRLFEDIDIKTPPYSVRYPELDGFLETDYRTNLASGNLVVNCEKGFIARGGPPEVGQFVLENNEVREIEFPSGGFKPERLVEDLGTFPLGEVGAPWLGSTR